jgi:hypothetical protein
MSLEVAPADRTGYKPQRLPSVYRTKKRFCLMNETKAFFVKSLMWFYGPSNGRRP